MGELSEKIDALKHLKDKISCVSCCKLAEEPVEAHCGDVLCKRCFNVTVEKGRGHAKCPKCLSKFTSRGYRQRNILNALRDLYINLAAAIGICTSTGDLLNDDLPEGPDHKQKRKIIAGRPKHKVENWLNLPQNSFNKLTSTQVKYVKELDMPDSTGIPSVSQVKCYIAPKKHYTPVESLDSSNVTDPIVSKPVTEPVKPFQGKYQKSLAKALMKRGPNKQAEGNSNPVNAESLVENVTLDPQVCMDAELSDKEALDKVHAAEISHQAAIEHPRKEPLQVTSIAEHETVTLDINQKSSGWRRVKKMNKFVKRKRKRLNITVSKPAESTTEHCNDDRNFLLSDPIHIEPCTNEIPTKINEPIVADVIVLSGSESNVDSPMTKDKLALAEVVYMHEALLQFEKDNSTLPGIVLPVVSENVNEIGKELPNTDCTTVECNEKLNISVDLFSTTDRISSNKNVGDTLKHLQVKGEIGYSNVRSLPTPLVCHTYPKTSRKTLSLDANTEDLKNAFSITKENTQDVLQGIAENINLTRSGQVRNREQSPPYVEQHSEPFVKIPPIKIDENCIPVEPVKKKVCTFIYHNLHKLPKKIIPNRTAFKAKHKIPFYYLGPLYKAVEKNAGSIDDYCYICGTNKCKREVSDDDLDLTDEIGQQLGHSRMDIEGQTAPSEYTMQIVATNNKQPVPSEEDRFGSCSVIDETLSGVQRDNAVFDGHGLSKTNCNTIAKTTFGLYSQDTVSNHAHEVTADDNQHVGMKIVNTERVSIQNSIVPESEHNQSIPIPRIESICIPEPLHVDVVRIAETEHDGSVIIPDPEYNTCINISDMEHHRSVAIPENKQNKSMEHHRSVAIPENKQIKSMEHHWSVAIPDNKQNKSMEHHRSLAIPDNKQNKSMKHHQSVAIPDNKQNKSSQFAEIEYNESMHVVESPSIPEFPEHGLSNHSSSGNKSTTSTNTQHKIQTKRHLESNTNTRVCKKRKTFKRILSIGKDSTDSDSDDNFKQKSTKLSKPFYVPYESLTENMYNDVTVMFPSQDHKKNKTTMKLASLSGSSTKIKTTPISDISEYNYDDVMKTMFGNIDADLNTDANINQRQSYGGTSSNKKPLEHHKHTKKITEVLHLDKCGSFSSELEKTPPRNMKSGQVDSTSFHSNSPMFVDTSSTEHSGCALKLKAVIRSDKTSQLNVLPPKQASLIGTPEAYDNLDDFDMDLHCKTLGPDEKLCRSNLSSTSMLHASPALSPRTEPAGKIKETVEESDCEMVESTPQKPWLSSVKRPLIMKSRLSLGFNKSQQSQTVPNLNSSGVLRLHETSHYSENLNANAANIIHPVSHMSPKQKQDSTGVNELRQNIIFSPIKDIYGAGNDTKNTPKHSNNLNVTTPLGLEKFAKDIQNRSTPFTTKRPIMIQGKLLQKLNTIEENNNEDCHGELPSTSKLDYQENSRILERKKMIISTSGFSYEFVNGIKLFADKFQLEFRAKASVDITHLIVKVDENNCTDRTVKFVCALASGAWVLSLKWVENCVKVGTLVNEQPYEVLDADGEPTPKLFRDIPKKSLLSFMSVIFVGETNEFPFELIKEVFIACGAKYLNSLEVGTSKCNIIFMERDGPTEVAHEFFEKTGFAVVGLEWLHNCICSGKGKLIPIEKYLMYPYHIRDIPNTEGFPQELLYSDPSDSAN